MKSNQFYRKGKIQSTSQKKYKKLEKFFYQLYCSYGQNDPEANDIEIYLKQNDLTICCLNSLYRLKIIKSIPFHSEQKQLLQIQRITAQEKVQPQHLSRLGLLTPFMNLQMNCPQTIIQQWLTEFRYF
ncbi:unnamed protein product [Paramecium octaurelia]|uniref:Uncharacterized protein n=1 Tax=Paramecium octaurelia TaxID=43137 RepID=A0A8S1XEX9_PAROT|nr:unnamed protein product [Paramecium octaurelia]